MSLRDCSIVLLAVGLGAALPVLAAAPPSWTIAGNAPADYEFAVDKATGTSGKQSASIVAKPGARADGFGTLMQTIAADNYRGDRLRLSGYLRTEAASRAQMWMRVDGPGGKVLGFDNMDSRPVTGTTAWRRYDIVLDVPADSVDIAFGFFLISSGKVWGDDFKLERVDGSVPVTSTGSALARVPGNLDFEDTGSSQTAVWRARKLEVLFPAQTFRMIGFENCDLLYEDVRRFLLTLGARASDLQLKEIGCPGDPSGVEATFSVLVPTATPGHAGAQANAAGQTNAAAEPVEGRWQTVEIRFDVVPHDEIYTGSHVNNLTPLFRQQTLVWLVKQKILPLFPARDVMFSSGTSLSAQVLKPQ